MGKPTWDEYKKPKLAKMRTTQGLVCKVRIDGEKGICDTGPTTTPTYTPTDTLAIKIPAPVSVINVCGEEQISYRPAEMAQNELYPVEWNGKNYALRKSGEKIELFKFYPASDD